MQSASYRLGGGGDKIAVIQVCAPTTDHEDEEVEQFYEQFDSFIVSYSVGVLGQVSL